MWAERCARGKRQGTSWTDFSAWKDGKTGAGELIRNAEVLGLMVGERGADLLPLKIIQINSLRSDSPVHVAP